MANKDFPKKITVPALDAARITLVKVLETECQPPEWSAQAGDQASADARQLVGDKASWGTWLAQRAQLVMTRYNLKDALIAPSAQHKDWLARTLTLLAGILALAGYLLGAFSDRLASTGSLINLLAPPLLGLLFWNVLVYLLLLLRAGMRILGIRFELPLQKGLIKLVHTLGLAKMPGKKLTRAFFAAYMPLRMPGLSHRIARAAHLAAIAFAVGVLTSIAIRGIGTAYSVGWESTWFAGRADLVHTLLTMIYGWIPVLPNTTPIPDVSTVATLEVVPANAAMLATHEAAPWLWRLIQAVVWIVIIPRSLLVLWETLWIRRRANAMTLPLEGQYYHWLLRFSEQPNNPHFLVDEALMKSTSRWATHDELPMGLTDAVSGFSFWDAGDETTQATWRQYPQAIPVFNAVQTPEDDVHGYWLKTLEEKLPADYPVIVDFTLYDERLQDPQKRGGRQALWEDFIKRYAGRAIIITNTSSAQMIGEALLASKHLQ